MFSRLSKTVALLCSGICAPLAIADVNGGGATLPQPLYQTPGTLTAGFAPYIGVGSGAGKAAFLNNDYSRFVPGDTSKNVHWAASDSKLTAAELSTYLSAHGPAWGPLIQIPSAATSIAIPFNKAGAANVDLSVNQLCGIFSGRLTDWSQITSAGRTGAITVVYPQDSSGTTELFTRFLNAKCAETGFFVITTNFASSYSGGLPAGAVSANGSQGVMNAVNAGQGRITYMSPAYAASTLAGLEDATKVARIAGVSPAPANISAAIANIDVPAAYNRANPNAWVPVFAATYNPNDPSVVAYPTTGYPILGFTNLILSQCYADRSQTTQVRGFLTRHYGALAVNNNDSAIVANRLLPLSARLKTFIRTSFLTTSNGLSVGNPSVCNGIGRPL
ncbi:ABC-type phosphate transport system substrate-binding protein [Pseudomonas brassicacearum]|uniref:ABC-type phosphate transport system substrate-binding protein n=1 Tax=Pseudomonas brassicacearum TaxID=930166 RepID=A0AAW8M8L9_9PSED|nr:substrate-binding domain-containing protein [Pseudomonas brassicacearum]MDR6958135.1 ABC-type phosphate transport system substrate-binding protein [Pseudomonas brassicacearum]